MNEYEKFIAAFKIFAKYPHTGGISAEHDIVYAGPSPEDVSQEDIDALDELGWHIDEWASGFSKFV